MTDRLDQIRNCRSRLPGSPRSASGLAVQCSVGHGSPLLPAPLDPGPLLSGRRPAVCARLPASSPHLDARTLPLTLWDSGRRTWLAKALILLAALGVFVALHTANHLLGDGYLYLRDLDAGIVQSTQRAPLTFALIQVLHSAGSPLWETAENTYRLYSYASGVLFVLLSFPVAGTIGTTPREKSIVLAFLLSGGYLQLFFGYVETYALCLPGILLYLLLGLRVLEDRMSVLAPAILLSSACQPPSRPGPPGAVPARSRLAPPSQHTRVRDTLEEQTRYRGRPVFHPAQRRPLPLAHRHRSCHLPESPGRQPSPARSFGTRLS